MTFIKDKIEFLWPWETTLLNRSGLGILWEGLSSQVGDTVGKMAAVTGLVCVTRMPKETALSQGSKCLGPGPEAVGKWGNLLRHCLQASTGMRPTTQGEPRVISYPPRPPQSWNPSLGLLYQLYPLW